LSQESNYKLSERLDNVVERTGTDWDVTVDPRSGQAYRFASQGGIKYGGDARTAAETFVRDNADWLEINPANHQFYKTVVTNDIRHVFFRQVIGSHPIEGAFYSVHLRPNGQVDLAGGRRHDVSIADGSIVIGKEAAVTAARAYKSDLSEPEVTASPELVFLPLDDDLFLTWKLILDDSWIVYVKASDGVVVKSTSTVVSFVPNSVRDGAARPETIRNEMSSAPLESTTGAGYIFAAHPGLGGVVSGSLPRLIPPIVGTIYTLNGDYVSVKNDEASEVTSTSPNFYFPLSNTHFDEVNLYHHIDRIRNEVFEPLGFNEFDYVTATAHSTVSCFACYRTPPGDLHFEDSNPVGGPGPTNASYAHEDAVI